MKRHLLCAAVAALLFGAPLLWSLEISVPYRVRQAFATTEAGPFAPVDVPELRYLATRNGQSTYRLRLTAIHLERLIAEPYMELRVTDYGQARTMLSAELTIPAGNCRYETEGTQKFPTNSWLIFVRRQPCAQIRDAANELILTIRLTTPGNVAVWTAGAGPSGQADVALRIADRNRGQFAGRSVIGAIWHNDYSRAATRFALLTYVWQLPRRSLVTLLLAAVLLVGLSAGLLSAWHVRSEQNGRLAARPALAMFSAALALSIVYACVVPPFQAADETHHFVGLSHFLNRPELAAASTPLGQLGNLDRIAFHPDEHFNPSDVGHPGGLLMGGAEPDWDVRGRGVLALWRAFGPLLRRTNTVSGTLLLARLLNAVVFATAVGLFVVIVATLSPSAWPFLDAYALFVIPTLPFFGMFVSNYAPLCALYILFAAAIVIVVWDDPASCVAGPLMGVSWAGAVLLSRSAFPLAPLVLSCGAVRMILGPQRTAWSAALVFWIGLALPSAIAFSMIPQHLFDVAQTASTALPGMRPLLEIMRRPWLVTTLGIAASAAEMLLHHPTQHGEKDSSRLAKGVTLVGYAGAILLAASIVMSAFVDYPTAPIVDLQHVPSTRSYIGKTLLAAVTMFRFGHPDFLTSQSFWGGYGWLDTLLTDWLVAILTVSTGTAFVITLVWMARTPAYRAAVSYFVLVAGLLAAFATASFSVLRATPADLHGRYLLGIYLCLITLCWHWLPRMIPQARWRTVAVILCGLSVIAIHGLAYATILGRYFA